MVMAENAFTLLTLIAGPAVLTNACSVLALNTANRYGRAFDRAREVAREVAHEPPADPADGSRRQLFERLIGRATLLLRAQTAFFAAIALFVLSAIVSLVGAALSQEVRAWAPGLLVVALVVGLLGTGCVIKGCALTVRETRLALANLHDEHWLLGQTVTATEGGGRAPGDRPARAW
jgi:hypothetical protein